MATGLKITMDDRALAKLAARTKGLATGKFVKVGVLRSAGGDKEHDDDDITLVELAVIHHFGTDTIPARPFIRLALNAHRKQLRVLITKLSKAILAGRMDEDQALDILGKTAADEVKRYMQRGPHVPPPLADSTAKRKGSTRPLVDSGALKDAVTHEVSR